MKNPYIKLSFVTLFVISIVLIHPNIRAGTTNDEVLEIANKLADKTEDLKRVQETLIMSKKDLFIKYHKQIKEILYSNEKNNLLDNEILNVNQELHTIH